jgi:SpoVK/Ycf46/Vps4 family AAA+-type ATPase
MTTEPLRICGRPSVRFDIGKPGIDEQKQLWQNVLGSLAEKLNGEVDQVVSHFNIGISGIRSAGAEIVGRSQGGRIDLPQGTLWDVCTMQSRPRLDDLAARIEPRSSWDDLILPDLQKRTLRDLTAHVRQRLKVYEEWGFGRRGRGLSSTALFAGPSGTGKTLAAEVIAAELKLDLYHIDLSQIVSKYIGETEKNLRRIFDAAEEAGAVLLFDEADALFGKRSEVKDSHDRHANIEVSYLLQRMESYRGLAILTTNMKQALDTAFLRRIRFVVDFPFPDVAHRAEIWRRVYPAGVPCDGLDHTKLAKLNVAGGNIRNIALNAAFLAADEDEPVRMRHIFRAVRSEYLKLEKQLTDAEIKEWV